MECDIPQIMCMSWYIILLLNDMTWCSLTQCEMTQPNYKCHLMQKDTFKEQREESTVCDDFLTGYPACLCLEL